MPLRVLFVDMNSFFASVEQQLRPELRGRPIVVAAVNVDHTGCIAVSYEAKALGIRRGTPVWQVKQSRSVTVVEARPALYVRAHHDIISAVDTCLPVHSVDSIDELSCRLTCRQTELSAAIELASRIKRAIRERVGACLTCSIGLAPNKFLAKVASNRHKPDGLFVIETADLPQALYPLSLEDLPGIGPRMLARLRRSGVTSVEQLCRLTEPQMKKLWNGVVGQRWWHWLRGNDLPESPTRRSTVGHSHVLPPELRTEAGAEGVLLRLIQKAAARLRRLRHYARRMEVCVSFTFREEGWRGSVTLGTCQDTLTMIEAFHELWRWRPPQQRPTQVGVTFSDLVPASSASLPLFPEEQRRLNLCRVIDQLNDAFGANTVYFGGSHHTRTAAPSRIAFTQIPDLTDD